MNCQWTRASQVEPDAEGYWRAEMGPSGGPVPGPYESRSEALEAEKGVATGLRYPTVGWNCF
jgi:hypothetical protein